MPLRRAEPRAFASLLIAERRLSIVEIAAQLGHHTPDRVPGHLRHVIAHLDERDALHGRAEEALTRAAAHSLAASPLTVAEVLVGPARAGRADDAVGVLRALGVSEVPLPRDASTRLAELRARTGLKLPDCCALLAAEAAPADAVLTFNDRLQAEATRRGFRIV